MGDVRGMRNGLRATMTYSERRSIHVHEPAIVVEFCPVLCMYFLEGFLSSVGRCYLQSVVSLVVSLSSDLPRPLVGSAYSM